MLINAEYISATCIRCIHEQKFFFSLDVKSSRNNFSEDFLKSARDAKEFVET